MQVAVWDTYVTKKDGSVMHFDIIAPSTMKDEKMIHHYGKQYLKLKQQDDQPLTAKECSFCHLETLEPNREEELKKNGFYIIEMENCN